MYNVCTIAQEKEEADLLALGNFNAIATQEADPTEVILLNKMSEVLCLCKRCLNLSWPIALFCFSS